MNENRYERQLMLPELGAEGQKKIRSAKVLLVGVGGLGSPISTYLTGAGIGTLGLVDDDVVSVTNLHRQVLYSESEVGLSKAEQAKKRLSALNSDVKIETYPFRLTKENAEEIISKYDLVVDGCDNFATRYLIDGVCHRLDKPYVYGSIQGLNGQVSVFNVGENACRYRNLYPEEETVGYAPSKAVLGVTPAIVGSVEANQVLQLVAGFGTPLINKLWTVDLRTMESWVLDLV